MSDAAQLFNRTVPIANDPGFYVMSLDVFHELHSLVGRRSAPARSRSEMREADGIIDRTHCGNVSGEAAKQTQKSH